MWCHYCDKNNHNMADCRAIAKFKQQKTTRLALKPKLDPERSLWSSLFFSKKLMHLKGNWSLKRLQAVRRATMKAESILCTEINLTTSSDEGEKQEYLFTSSKPFRSSKTKLEKSSHPTINHWVGIESHFNNKEHLLRALADTGASSSIILEAYTSAPFIKTNDSNTTTWSTMGGKFITT
jgi:hypothetical protein